MQAADAPTGRSNAPSPEDTAKYLAELTKLKTLSRSVAGDIAALGGRVKSAGGPMYWKAIKRLHDLKKLDPDEARAELEALVQVAAQQDIRIAWMGNQATFADIMDQNQAPGPNTSGTRDLAKARANSDGFNSGLNGGIPADNPFRHKPGSEEYVAWHNGRDDGQATREKRKPEEAARVAAAAEADQTLPDDGAARTGHGGEAAPAAAEPIF